MIVETILVALLFVEPKAVPIEDCPFLFKKHWFWKRRVTLVLDQTSAQLHCCTLSCFLKTSMHAMSLFISECKYSNAGIEVNI